MSTHCSPDAAGTSVHSSQRRQHTGHGVAVSGGDCDGRSGYAGRGGVKVCYDDSRSCVVWETRWGYPLAGGNPNPDSLSARRWNVLHHACSFYRTSPFPGTPYLYCLLQSLKSWSTDRQANGNRRCGNFKRLLATPRPGAPPPPLSWPHPHQMQILKPGAIDRYAYPLQVCTK